MQNTLRKKVAAEGKGIHYNRFARLVLSPAPENTGIVFKRIDLPDSSIHSIPAIYTNVISTQLSTKIANASGVSVSTVEHLMAALFICEVTNLFVEIDNIEVPIMEGGSEDFCFLIECAGLQPQKSKANMFRVLKEVKVENEAGYIIASPSNFASVKFTSNFDSASIGEQQFYFDFKKTNFIKEIASAKTIANLNEVEFLQKKGLGLGGNLQNTLVFNKENILNEKHLFHISDFVKHKVLDFIGDIALAGNPIIADFTCYKSGHTLNSFLLKEIFSNENNYQLI